MSDGKQLKHRRSHEISYSESINIPAAQCDISGKCINRELCCDIKQKDAHHKACPIEHHRKPAHLKIKAACPQVKQGPIDIGVKLNPKCVKPGTAYVQGPNVKVGRQKMIVDVYQPKGNHCSPDINVKCEDRCVEIGKPKIHYTPGCVEFEDKPEWIIRYHDCHGKLVSEKKKGGNKKARTGRK